MNWAMAVERASVGELVWLRSMIDQRLMTRRGVECTCCKKTKRREDFSPNPYKKNGLQSHCRECRAGYARRQYRLEVLDGSIG